MQKHYKYRSQDDNFHNLFVFKIPSLKKLIFFFSYLDFIYNIKKRL